MRVGVFDSGVGGLTVLKELVKKHPNNEYIYFGDTLNMPYGNKDMNKLIKLSDNIIKFLLTKNVDIIIIACGTLSATCFNILKDKYNIIIYDVISPTINYFNKNKLNNLKVIATNNTINSGIFSNIYNIKQVSSSTLAYLIENNCLKNDIENEIKSLINKDDENIILGCTHYPFIEDIIRNIYPQINIYNMGTILAESISLKDSKKSIEIYFSKLNKNNIIITNKLFKDVKVSEYNAGTC